MISISRIQKIGRRLTIPCLFCGGPIFSLSCKRIDHLKDLSDSRFCFTVSLDNKSPFDHEYCHTFCSFICSKRSISIDSDDVIPHFFSNSHDTGCTEVNDTYDKLFESFFQEIQLDRGYKI